jgi:acrylyl-CoA reductase (NADPH)
MVTASDSMASTTGGVGSVAVSLLAALGHEVAAVTGRPESEAYLRALGAARIVPRAELAEASAKPMESETWAGCVDAVGGVMVSRVLKQLKYRCAVAAVGLAGGADVPLSIVPFLLRGVNLLGIDSVLQPYDNRVRAWARVARDLPLDRLEDMIVPATLRDLPELGRAILQGQVQGRVVVDLNG